MNMKDMVGSWYEFEDVTGGNVKPPKDTIGI